MKSKFLKMMAVPAALTLMSSSAFAGEAAVSNEMFTVNNIWVLIATFLVFVMHLGFATLEAGLTRAKNTVNILFKNTIIVAIGILTYTLIGFALMFRQENWLFEGAKIIGLNSIGVQCPEGDAGLIAYNGGNCSYWAFFLFQGMFAATAATIVSGAVAERIKLNSFIIFSAVYVALVYPLIGSWGWGGGWLADMGFYDFAGSTFVHSVGGWAALAGVLFLGPRTGKYVVGVSKPVFGHSMPLATIGVFLLWLGWFGFNGGSVLSADAGAVSYVFVTTTLAAAAGIIGAMIVSSTVQHKPDLSMVLNGCLAGLVGVTAGADQLSIISSIVVGFIAGILVVLCVLMFDRLKLDDPVGALSVHLVCGIWGTLAVGIFIEDYSFWVQLLGVAVVGVFSFAAASIIFAILKASMGIRVSEEEELGGLDLGEHGMEAYAGFQIFSNQ